MQNNIYNLKEGDEYWYIRIQGIIESVVWDGGGEDCGIRNYGGVFLTKHDAELELKKRESLTKIKKWSIDNDGNYKFKWNEFKYYLFLDGLDEKGAEITVIETYVGKDIGTIYYSSEEIAEKASKELEDEYMFLFKNN